MSGPQNQSISSAPRRGTWRAVPESGTVWGVRFLAGLARLAGRRITGWFLYVVCFYYALLHGPARRASYAYWRQLGHTPTFFTAVRHLHCFAQTALDRLFFVTGRWQGLEIVRHGHEILVEATTAGRGALLVGAHVGSFEAMRAAADHFAVPLTIVVNFTNAERVNRVLRALSADSQFQVISLGGDEGGELAAMLAIREVIDRGGLVALLADRHDGHNDRVIWAPCLGAPARFPMGPWVLAHTLGCPVYFVAGLYHKPKRYDLYCERLVERVVLPRGARHEAASHYAAQFADLVTKYARRAPYNWFNFYDFWGRA